MSDITDSPVFKPTDTSPDAHLAPAKKVPWNIISIVVGILILVVATSGASYYLGSHGTKSDDHNQVAEVTPTVTATTTPTSTPTVTGSTTPTPTTDVYAGWKTYTNATYGYSFKYPASWVLDLKQSEGAPSHIALAVPNTEMSWYADFNIYTGDTGCGSDDLSQTTMYIGSTKATTVQVCHDAAKLMYEFKTRTSQGKTIWVNLWHGLGQDANVDLLAKSITGLTPVSQ